MISKAQIVRFSLLVAVLVASACLAIASPVVVPPLPPTVPHVNGIVAELSPVVVPPLPPTVPHVNGTVAELSPVVVPPLPPTVPHLGDAAPQA